MKNKQTLEQVMLAIQNYKNNLGESERASQAVSDLLELNYSTAEGKEQTTTPTETGGGESTPPPAEPTGPGAAELGPELAAAEEEPTPAPEETPAEA
jgi:hypothetical protein